MSKRSKLLLGIVTIIPTACMVLFLITVFSLTSGAMRAGQQKQKEWEQRQKDELRAALAVSVVELERMIQNGEVRELRMASDGIFAVDRNERISFLRTSDETRNEIVAEARTKDANGNPLVPTIDENTSSSDASTTDFLIDRFPRLLPLYGIAIALMLGLMGYYVSRVLSNPRLDSTTRIIWVVLICLLSVWVMPFYWLLYVWRDSDPQDEMTGLGLHARV